MKKISLFILAIFFTLASFLIPVKKEVFADTWHSAVTFRGFGDSIAAGDTLSDNVNYQVGVNITQGCYTEVLSRNYITAFGGSVVNFAQSGDRTSGGQSGGMVTKLAPYTDQTAQDYTEFFNTDVITVCIGANNVLTPATANLQSYLMNFGEEQEEELRATLQAGLDLFEQDYLNTILPTLVNNTKEDAQILVMTIYNPYKYTHISDVNNVETNQMMRMVVQQAIARAETNFQNILSIAMEYLDEVNEIIKSNAGGKVKCVDIHSLFETFTEEQYKSYINSDLSKLDVDSSITSKLNTLTAYADPHPTAQGQSVIAGEFEKYVVFSRAIIDTSLSGKLSPTAQVSVSLQTIGGADLSFKLYSQKNGQSTLLYTGAESSCNVVASDLGSQGTLYYEIYSGQTKLGTSNQVDYRITFEGEEEEPIDEEEKQDQEETSGRTDPSANTEDKKVSAIVVICIIAGGGVIAGGIVIFFIIKSVGV